MASRRLLFWKWHVRWGGGERGRSSREGAQPPPSPLYPSGFWFTKTQIDPCFLSWASMNGSNYPLESRGSAGSHLLAILSSVCACVYPLLLRGGKQITITFWLAFEDLIDSWKETFPAAGRIRGWPRGGHGERKTMQHGLNTFSEEYFLKDQGC